MDNFHEFSEDQMKEIYRFGAEMLHSDRIEDSLVVAGQEVRFSRPDTNHRVISIDLMKQTTEETDLIIESQQKRNQPRHQRKFNHDCIFDDTDWFFWMPRTNRNG